MTANTHPADEREKIRTDLYRAAISCGHCIDAEQVVLFREPTKPGVALAQLADRLAEVFDAAMTEKDARIAALSSPAAPAQPVVAQVGKQTDQREDSRELKSVEIERGWRDTFSTENPFCPCNLKTFTKAVRWAEGRIAAIQQTTADTVQGGK